MNFCPNLFARDFIFSPSFFRFGTALFFFALLFSRFLFSFYRFIAMIFAFFASLHYSYCTTARFIAAHSYFLLKWKFMYFFKVFPLLFQNSPSFHINIVLFPTFFSHFSVIFVPASSFSPSRRDSVQIIQACFSLLYFTKIYNILLLHPKGSCVTRQNT